MKKLLKFATICFAIANILPFCENSALATSNNNYYYDVKKAGDYVLNYCDTEHDDYGLPEGRIKKSNNVFITLDSDCTNFVSQALYYGGYPMKGTPYYTNPGH